LDNYIIPRWKQSWFTHHLQTQFPHSHWQLSERESDQNCSSVLDRLHVSIYSLSNQEEHDAEEE